MFIWLLLLALSELVSFSTLIGKLKKMEEEKKLTDKVRENGRKKAHTFRHTWTTHEVALASHKKSKMVNNKIVVLLTKIGLVSVRFSIEKNDNTISVYLHEICSSEFSLRS